MKIELYEMFNVVIALLLIFLIKRQRDTITLLLVLFVYGTLHFGYAVFFHASRNYYADLTDIHINGSGLLASISAISLLGVVFVQLVKNALQSYPKEKMLFVFFSFFMLAVIIGYCFNLRFDDWLQFKNIVSIEVMFALLLVGYVGLRDATALNANSINVWIIFGLIILGIANLIGIYEVFSHRSWAGTLESSGAMVYRASSILFNPNLLGFWASLLYLGSAFAFHTYPQRLKLMLLGMILTSIAIYFSGSRSTGYLLFVALVISTWLMKERLRWVPLLVLPITMSVIYAWAAWVAPTVVSSKNGWHEIALLGERFAATPLHLINYVLNIAGVPTEIVLAIEGRFIGEGRDSGWFVLYQDAGWLGLAAVVCAAFMLIAWGVRAQIALQNSSSAYALGMLIYCLLTGFVMRYQIFPVWLFITLALIPCVVFWRRHFPLNFLSKN